jgi:hypothetical protein
VTAPILPSQLTLEHMRNAFSALWKHVGISDSKAPVYGTGIKAEDIGSRPITSLAGQLSEARAMADSAQKALDKLGGNLDAAITDINIIGNSNVLSMGMKPYAVLDLDVLQASQSILAAQATTQSLSSAGFDLAMSNLEAYLQGAFPGSYGDGSLGGLQGVGNGGSDWGNSLVNSPIDGPTWNSAWGAAYTQQMLLEAALAGQSAAAILALDSNGILSRANKPGAILMFNGLEAQVSTLRTQAISLGAALPTQETLTAYLNLLIGSTSRTAPSWMDITQDTIIPDPNVWQSQWTTLYAEIANLHKAISASLTNGTTPIGGRNLLWNSSFEVDSNNDGIADGWLIYNNGSTTVYPALTTGGMFGTNAQRLNFAASSSTSTMGIRHQLVTSGTAFQPNTSYVLSFYARGFGTCLGGVFGLRFNTSPTTIDTLLNPAMTGTWQRYAFRLNWGATVDTDFFVTGLTDAGGYLVGGGMIDFDGFQLELGTVPTGYSPNPQEAITGVGQINSNAWIAPVDQINILQALKAESQTRAALYNACVPLPASVVAFYTSYVAETQALDNYLTSLGYESWPLATAVAGSMTTISTDFAAIAAARKALENAIVNYAQSGVNALNSQDSFTPLDQAIFIDNWCVSGKRA